MYNIRVVFLLAIVTLCSSCDSNHKPIDEELACCGDSPSWINAWHLSETGYSPGSGYIIREVPASDNQYIVLHSDGSVTSNMECFAGLRRFTVTQDNDDLLLLLFTNDPSTSQPDARYRVVIESNKGKLNLYNPMCIEGCHMGFVPR